MTNQELLLCLNSIEFPERYWGVCERFPLMPRMESLSCTKANVLSAFRSMDEVVIYDSRDRSYMFGRETIGGVDWVGNFVKQRSGDVEILLSGKNAESGRIGSNFAVLAYQSKQAADPSFSLERFTGPPRYPRPNYNGDPEVLKNLVHETVELYRCVKFALRSRAA